jgi:hypothetical protein
VILTVTSTYFSPSFLPTPTSYSALPSCGSYSAVYCRSYTAVAAWQGRMELTAGNHAPAEEKLEYEMLRDARVAEVAEKFKLL